MRPAAPQPRRSVSSPLLLPPAVRPQRVEIGALPQWHGLQRQRCDPVAACPYAPNERGAAAPPRRTPTARRSAAARDRLRAARSRSAARDSAASRAATRRSALLLLLLSFTCSSARCWLCGEPCARDASAASTPTHAACWIRARSRARLVSEHERPLTAALSSAGSARATRGTWPDRSSEACCQARLLLPRNC